jgi:HPt (histidine-containing phosphotransfer) domain-containing protein
LKKRTPFTPQHVIDDMQGDIDGYREVALAFLEDARDKIQALSSKRWHSVDDLLEVMHEAANSAGIIGATASSHAIRDLENRLRKGERLDLAEAAQFTQCELTQTVADMIDWMGRLARGKSQ